MSIEKDINLAEKTHAKLMEKVPTDLDKIEGRIFEKLSKSKRSNLTKLDNLYGVMSKLSKFVFNYTPCRKFCSKCCYISEIEILHIEKNYNIKKMGTLSLTLMVVALLVVF